jgi:hypothetical protein
MHKYTLPPLLQCNGGVFKMHKIALNVVYVPRVFKLYFSYPDDNSFNHSARQHSLQVVSETRPELDRIIVVEKLDCLGAITVSRAARQCQCVCVASMHMQFLN